MTFFWRGLRFRVWNCKEDYSARRISTGSIRSARKTAGTVATVATTRITAQGICSKASLRPASPVEAKLVIGSAVVNRQVEPLKDADTLSAGQTVYAWTQTSGPGGGFIEHVWYCDGKAVARHYLPLGEAKHWRTWSRHKLGAGAYRVEVLCPDGKKLQEATFSVAAAD